MVPVPPLLALALGALGAAFVVKHFAKKWRRADGVRTKEPAIGESEREKAPKLRRDPHTGVYRP